MPNLAQLANVINIDISSDEANSSKARKLFNDRSLLQQIDNTALLELFQLANDSTTDGNSLMADMVSYIERISQPRYANELPPYLVLDRDLITKIACVNSAMALRILQGELGKTFYYLPYEANGMAVVKAIFINLLQIATTHSEVLKFLHVGEFNYSYVYRQMVGTFQKDETLFPNFAALLATLDKLDVESAVKISDFYHNYINVLSHLLVDKKYLSIAIGSKHVSGILLKYLLHNKYGPGKGYFAPNIPHDFIFEIVKRWPELSEVLINCLSNEWINMSEVARYLKENEVKDRMLQEVLPVIAKNAEQGDYAAKCALSFAYFTGYYATGSAEQDRYSDMSKALELLQDVYENADESNQQQAKKLLECCARSYADGKMLYAPLGYLSNEKILRSFITAAQIYTLTDNQERLAEPWFSWNLSKVYHQVGSLITAFQQLQTAKFIECPTDPYDRKYNIYLGQYKDEQFHRIAILMQRAQLIQEIIAVVASKLNKTSKNLGCNSYYSQKTEDKFSEITFLLAQEAYEQKNWLTAVRLLHMAGGENPEIYTKELSLKIAVKLLLEGKSNDACYLLKKIPSTSAAFQKAQNLLKPISDQVKNVSELEVETAVACLDRTTQLHLTKPYFEKVLAEAEALLQNDSFSQDERLVKETGGIVVETKTLIGFIEREIAKESSHQNPSAAALTLGIVVSPSKDDSSKTQGNNKPDILPVPQHNL